MWHVRYVEVYGKLTFEREYVSGYTAKRDGSNNKVRHAVDKNLRTLCGAEMRPDGVRIVRFDTQREPITCQRCLYAIEMRRKSDDVAFWEEE